MSFGFANKPTFDLDMTLAVVLYMVNRSVGLDRFAVARALLTEGVGDVDQRNLLLSIESHYEGESRKMVRTALDQAKQSRSTNEEQRRVQAKRKYDKAMAQGIARAKRDLLGLSEDELLAVQESWRRSNPSTERLMTQQPRGLGVNAP